MKKNLIASVLVVLALGVAAACSSSPRSAATLLSSSVQAAPTSTITKTGLAAADTSLSAQAPTPPTVTASPSSSGVLAAFQGTLEQVYENTGPSVVNIRTTTSGGQSPFGRGLQQFSAAEGSGFVWDNQGDIVTNNHVISGATTITVTFSDGTTVPAKLVGADPDADLAVIKVEAFKGLPPPVKVADSDGVKVGRLAIAIGNPFGLSGSMTVGIVSARGRLLPAGEGSAIPPSLPGFSIPDVIQTDAPINPGNSGGVLLDDQGRLIGVPSAIQSNTNSSAGVGFAIPSNIVKKVAPALIASGRVDHAYLGISGTTVMPDIARAMNLPDGQRGALVVEVIAHGPASAAGLNGSIQQATINGQQARVGGDVITAVDGRAVKSMDDLITYLFESTSVGQKVTFTVLRSGSQTTVQVTLGARPGSQQTTSS
ncbi:MAG: trypsin-like peptidase domain-containing protein [Chloroflexi bacterium]|nr:trypsin-like peptidase domain-containing protein [Chloroflexota bacterium]